MSQENATYLQLLEKRIELLNSLSDAILGARKAITTLDLGSLESHIARQQALCSEIQRLNAQTKGLCDRCASTLNGRQLTTRSPELETTLCRLREAELSLKQLNKTHRALLSRSRRTVTALQNCLHADGNYRDAALQQRAHSYNRSGD